MCRLLVALLLVHRRTLIARRELLEADQRAEKSESKQKKKLGDTATVGDVVETHLDATETPKAVGDVNMNIWSYNDLLWRVVAGVL